ncbi:MAG: energy-coupling factor ABC transporter permease [Clostridia bacterium]|nr:energy-coupling factor ABC transporter permease [Clostridia bacterium]
MHLIDGVLPPLQAAAYGAVSAAFVAAGIKRYQKNSIDKINYKILSGVFTAFVFTATVFEIPMPFGSTEHPTGTPLMAIFLGPIVTPFLSTVVLLLELLLREGGITTLGANVFSLGVVGGSVGWCIFYLSRKLKLGLFWSGLLAGFLGDICVYFVTALQLGIANTDGKSFIYYFIMFVPGQIPLAVIEGVFTGLVLQFLYKRRIEFLKELGVVK